MLYQLDKAVAVDADVSGREKQPARAMKILTVATSFPFPPDDGTKIQIYQRIKYLAAHNEVTLLCVHNENVHPAHVARMEEFCHCHLIQAPRRQYSKSVPSRIWHLLKSLIQGVPDYERNRFSEQAARWIWRETRERGFDIIEADDSAGMYLSPDLLARRVQIFHHIEDTTARKELRFSDNGAAKLGDLGYWLAARNFQKRLGRSADLCVTLTEQNARELLNLDRHIPVRPCLSNGIDLDYFEYAPDPATPAGVCFVGKMDYRPNEDAVCYFHERIFPIIRKRQPHLRFWIVGSNPTPAVKALASDPAVKITGRVDDVRPYLRRAGIAVVPVRMGGGILNKVLEALAMGVPVVTRTPALDGLSAVPGRDLAISDDENGFAGQVLDLVRDPELRASRARNGRDYVERHHRWEAMVARYESELRALFGDREGDE